MTEEVSMAAKSDIDELKKERRELNKRNAYLEDEVAYIKTLIEVMLKDKREDDEKSSNTDSQ